MKNEIEVYNDGRFHLYKIIEKNTIFPKEELKDMEMDVWFKELSVGDRLKNDLKQSGIEVTTKIRIPQYKKITSKCVVEIDGELHHVYNAYHFRDSDDILKTDITLERFENEKGRAD